MTLAEVYGMDFSVRKTVWSKRGDRISRRMVDQPPDQPAEAAAATDAAPPAAKDAADAT